MTDADARIAQFEKMAQADPDNDMAHFSLGNACLQVGRFADAARSLLRCVELNPDMSKAYQLAGDHEQDKLESEADHRIDEAKDRKLEESWGK